MKDESVCFVYLSAFILQCFLRIDIRLVVVEQTALVRRMLIFETIPIISLTTLRRAVCARSLLLRAH